MADMHLFGLKLHFMLRTMILVEKKANCFFFKNSTKFPIFVCASIKAIKTIHACSLNCIMFSMHVLNLNV